MAKWDLSKLSNVSQKEKPMTKYTRGEILDTAKQYVNKDRASEHGDMESNLITIANLWSVYLDTLVKPHDVGVMMTMLKIARIKSNPKNADNWMDACGYMACGGELSADKPDIPEIKFQGGNT